MKKVFLALIILLPLLGKAQKFYDPSEISVELKVWDSEADVDYLVQNGKPLSYFWNFNCGYDGICATYLNKNKFVALHFKNNNTFELYDYSHMWPMTYLNGNLANLEYFPWFTGFNFDKIVYDIWWNRILIPIGTDTSTGHSYAISIYFTDNESGIYTTTADEKLDDNNISYYNLQGQKVELESSKGQILIKTDGKRSTKILNK